MSRQENQSASDPVGVDPVEAGRRRFLQMAVATGIAFQLGVGTADAGQPNLIKQLWQKQPLQVWMLEAARIEQTFSDGSILPYHRYRALGSTPVAGSVPVLTGAPGEILRVRMRNSLSYTIRPMIVGGMLGPTIAPGEVVTLDLVVPTEGTWLLTDELLGDAAGPMGLGAVIISRPHKNGLRGGRRSSVLGYDREYVLLYVDSDDRWNTAIDTGLLPDYTTYEPNYHTVNNLTFPDTASDPGTLITCQVGERVLLRMCNLGWVRQSVHFHGYHVDIQRINNQPQSIFGPKDTIPLPGHTTLEALLTVNQPGVFPVHPHSLTTTTDNGLYIGGQITLISAT